VDDVAGKRPGEVSGGQGQRVAVARALVTSPKVIFADERPARLDSLNGERVMTLLVEAAKQTNAAVLLVTHEARGGRLLRPRGDRPDGKSRQFDFERVGLPG